MHAAHSLILESSLLLPLNALLQEKHVSRAAARVGLTQSAMSRVLARLREALGDPILVRSGRTMTLSPRAERLAAPLRANIATLEQVLGRDDVFDPAKSRRRFRIATVDYGAAVGVVPLLQRIRREAPFLEIDLETLRSEALDELETGTLDFVLAPMRRSQSSIVWTKLPPDPFVSVVRKDHPLVKKKLDLDLYCKLSHIVVVPERRATSAVDRWLSEAQRSRHVGLRVPSFLVAPLAVANSDMLLTTPDSAARIFAESHQLRLLPCPVPLEGVTLALGWHERQRTDQGHIWLRRLILETISKKSGGKKRQRHGESP
jgi:DNA-binding transcriptional LysR family regulator